MRGAFFSEPLLRAQSNVSHLKSINHLVPNPIIAFAWATSDYRFASEFFPVPKSEGEVLAKKAQIASFKTTASNTFLEKHPPHVILNLMESFGSNLLSFDDPKTFDLLASLRFHFESDFVFKRFLPGANGTAPSLSALFFNSPSVNIGVSQVKHKKLEGSIFDLYAKRGYEVVFITAGNASWGGYGDYMQTQGAHKVYDANTLMDFYPDARQYRTVYGIPDEYVYQFLEKLLQESQKPLFICILTISNHPPEVIPTHYKPHHLTKDISEFLPSQKRDLIVGAYQYANDSFGKFLNFIKTSPFKDQIIIAATGDHKMRSMTPFKSSKEFLNYAVPLYLYIPKPYLESVGFAYDPKTLGSHKDIIPTLLSYSLSNARYFANGGENMLDSKIKDRFAYNAAIFADSLGIYVNGYCYPWKNELEVSRVALPAPQEMIERFQAYSAYQWWQIRARSRGVF